MLRRATAPAAGRIVSLPEGFLTAPRAALPSQNGFQRQMRAQEVPLGHPNPCPSRWDVVGVAGIAAPGVMNSGRRARRERRREGSLGHHGGGWKGILPSSDLWGDFSQILSVFQALGEQKRDCTHGWVEELKMCKFST